MIHGWVVRRWIEADYRLIEARNGDRWWDDRHIRRRYRIREFWARRAGFRN